MGQPKNIFVFTHLEIYFIYIYLWVFYIINIIIDIGVFFPDIFTPQLISHSHLKTINNPSMLWIS